MPPDRPRKPGASLGASCGYVARQVRQGFQWRDWGRFHWRDAAVRPGVRAALGVLTPLIIGTAVGQVEYGTYAALGALPAGFVTFSGVTRTRVLNVTAAAVGMAISAFIGSATAGGMAWIASTVLARSLRALKPPGPLPPLRQLQAAVSGQPDADRVVLTTTDAIVDAVNSTTDILHRYLTRTRKQGSTAPTEG